MARGRSQSKRASRATETRQGGKTTVTVELGLKEAAMPGRRVQPPTGHVHDAQKATARYKRRETSRTIRGAVRSGSVDDL